MDFLSDLLEVAAIFGLGMAAQMVIGAACDIHRSGRVMSDAELLDLEQRVCYDVSRRKWKEIEKED